jgi:hypothetical protein
MQDSAMHTSDRGMTKTLSVVNTKFASRAGL